MREKPHGQPPPEGGASSTGLEPNIAGLLCYLGAWITGIVFLVIEQKNSFVRFHALQSIVAFGGLMIISAILGWIPVVGVIFSTFIGILAFILWIVLMIKAYQGELYKLPLAGDVAEGILPATLRSQNTAASQSADSSGGPSAENAADRNIEAKVDQVSQKIDELGRRRNNYFRLNRTGRVIGYSFTILWNLALLVFFSFFHSYIAWYQTQPDGSIQRLPFLTSQYFDWLPLLIASLVLAIAGYIVLIIHDRYWLRETVEIILAIIGVVVIANLITIFPFNFDVIPDATAADIVPVVVHIVLIVTAVIMGISALVRLIRLVVRAAEPGTGQ